MEVAKELVVNPEKGLLDGGIIPYRHADENNLNIQEIETVCAHYGIDPYQPIREIPEDKLDIILYGTKEKIEFRISI